MIQKKEKFASVSHQLLVAMPGLLDPFFSGAVIYIAEHSSKGAMGLIINRLAEFDLTSLFSRVDISMHPSNSKVYPVFLGGPIQPDRGFVLHEPIGSWNSSLKISDSLALTSSRDILEATAQGNGPAKFIVSLGYSGWGPGQLDSELINNSWLTIPIIENELIFDVPAEDKLAAAFKVLGFDPSNLSGVVGHA
ncbi:MAG: hypothetical protein CBD16_02285 [Betaproteobacteria bacterium TMED156]|nr:MAG: hypothetical protein CBD16_02285 [Betaproteobacteria bacterium TMED156]